MNNTKIFHVPDRYVVPIIVTPLGFISCWRILYILHHPQERFFISNVITLNRPTIPLKNETPSTSWAEFMRRKSNSTCNDFYCFDYEVEATR